MTEAVARPVREDIRTVTPDNAEQFYTDLDAALTARAADEPVVVPEAKPVEIPAAEAKPAEEAKPATEAKPEAEKKVEAAADEAHVDDEDVNVDPADEAAKDRKKARLSERMSELVKQRKDAEAAAATAVAAKDAETAKEREARLTAERERDALKAKYEPPVTELRPEPDPTKYTDVAEFTKDLKAWAAEKTRFDDAQERDKQKQTEAAQSVQTKWLERQAAVRAEVPDYDAVIAAAAHVVVSDEVRDAILESEQGPRILLHLAQHSDVADRLKTLSTRSALVEIGRLETKVTPAAKAAAEAPKPAAETKPAVETPAAEVKPAVEVKPVVEVSRAPAPITPLTGSGTPVIDVPRNADGSFKGSFEEFKALRRAGKIK